MSSNKDAAVKLLSELPPIRDPRKRGMTDEERQQRVDLYRFAFGKNVVAQLDIFRPRPIFERPAGVPDDDEEAYELLRRSRGRTPNESDRRAARELVRWCYDVASAEQADAGTMLVLVEAHRGLLIPGDEMMAKEAGRIEMHARKHWEVDIRKAPDDAWQLRFWVAAAVRRKKTVSTWLMNGYGPPRFNPKHHDPAPEQGSWKDFVD